MGDDEPLTEMLNSNLVIPRSIPQDVWRLHLVLNICVETSSTRMGPDDDIVIVEEESFWLLKALCMNLSDGIACQEGSGYSLRRGLVDMPRHRAGYCLAARLVWKGSIGGSVDDADVVFPMTESDSIESLSRWQTN